MRHLSDMPTAEHAVNYKSISFYIFSFVCIPQWWWKCIVQCIKCHVLMRELVLTGLVSFLLKHHFSKSLGSFEGTLTAFKSISHKTLNFFVSQKKYTRKQNSRQQQLKAALRMVMARCWCLQLLEYSLRLTSWIPGLFKRQVQRGGCLRVTSWGTWPKAASPLPNQVRKVLLKQRCQQKLLLQSKPNLHLRQQVGAANLMWLVF